MRGKRHERSDGERRDSSKNPEQIHDRYILQQVRAMIPERQMFRWINPADIAETERVTHYGFLHPCTRRALHPVTHGNKRIQP